MWGVVWLNHNVCLVVARSLEPGIEVGDGVSLDDLNLLGFVESWFFDRLLVGGDV